MKKLIIAATVAALLTGCGQKSSDEYLIEGNKLLSSGDVKSASIEYKNALQQDKNFLPARLALAEIYVGTRKFDDAEKELDYIIKQSEENIAEQGVDISVAKRLLARTYHASQNGAQLVSTFNADTDDVEVLYYLFHEYMLAKDTDKAQTIFDKVSDVPDENSLFKILIEAEKAYLENDFDLALIKLNSKEAPTNHPAFGPWMIFKADVALSMRNVDDAIEALDTYTKAVPSDITRLFQLSNIRVRSGYGEDAKEDILKLLKGSPENALLNELDAIVRYESGDYEGALSSSKVASIQAPKNVTPRLIGAFSAIQLEQPDLALSNLEFIIDELPDSHPAQRLYIRLKAENGQLDGIGEKALSIDNLDSDDVTLLSSLGLGLMQSGNIEQAEKLAAKAKQLDDANNKTPSLGLLQLALNDDAGLDTLEGAFEQSPDDWIANSSLATAYLAKGKLDDALSLSSKWIESGKTIEGNMLASVVNARMGKLVDAQSNVEKVLEESPENPMAKATFVEILIASEQVEKAKEHVSKWVIERSDLGLYRTYISSMRGKNMLEESVDFISSDLKSKPSLNTDDMANLLVAQAAMLIPNANFAIELLSKQSAPEGEENAYWLVLTTAYNSLGDAENAETSYKRWLDVQPNNPMALMGFIRSLSENGDADTVLSTLDKYAPNYEDKTPIDILRVNLLIDKRDWSKARTIFSRLPDDVKSAPIAQGLGGVLDLQQGLTGSAVKKLEVAYADSPNERYLRWLSLGYQKAGDTDKQISVLESHVDAFPESYSAWTLLGNAALSVSDFKKGEQAYISALEYNPESPLILNNLAYAKIELAKYSDAIMYANKAIEILPGQPQLIDTLAVALLKSGKVEEALRITSATYEEKTGNVSDAFVLTYLEALVKNGDVRAFDAIYETHVWKDLTKKREAKALAK